MKTVQVHLIIGTTTTFTSKLFSELNVQFSKQILLILLEYLIGHANDGGNAVRQQHQTLKSVTD